MPFKSEAQRRFLWSNHPDIAQRWTDNYGTPKNLPKRVGKKKRYRYRGRPKHG